MSYPYGMKGTPEVGKGLGGLPRRAATGSAPFTRSSYSRIVPDNFTGDGTIDGDTSSGVLIPPEGAVAMRVAVIGGGGGWAKRTSSSNNSERGACGGGGGGCAATKIIKAAPISYSIGAGGASSSGAFGGGTIMAGSGGASTATFSDYSLNANGGVGGFLYSTSLLTGTRPGGMGSGGDYNYQGGASSERSYYGSSAGGGGAAPSGPGGGEFSYVSFSATGLQPEESSGWGVGGGQGGQTSSSYTAMGGGAGANSVGGSNQRFDATVLANNPFGRTNGEMGGGGSSRATSTYSDTGAYGGSGGMVVEWFYTD